MISQNENDLKNYADFIIDSLKSEGRWKVENRLLREIKEASSDHDMQWGLENVVEDFVRVEEPKYRLPRSFLDHFARIQLGYYERFAKDHFTEDGKSRDICCFDIGPRLAYHLAAGGKYGKAVGGSIIGLREHKSDKREEVNILELGSAEAFVLLKILEYVMRMDPELFSHLIYHSVDFASNNIEIQKRQLKAFGKHVEFYCQDGTNLSNFPDNFIDFCMMNEFFDDIEQTEVYRYDGQVYLVGLERDSGGWGAGFLDIAIDQNIDSLRVKEYMKRLIDIKNSIPILY